MGFEKAPSFRERTANVVRLERFYVRVKDLGERRKEVAGRFSVSRFDIRQKRNRFETESFRDLTLGQTEGAPQITNEVTKRLMHVAIFAEFATRSIKTTAYRHIFSVTHYI